MAEWERSKDGLWMWLIVGADVGRGEPRPRRTNKQCQSVSLPKALSKVCDQQPIGSISQHKCRREVGWNVLPFLTGDRRVSHASRGGQPPHVQDEILELPSRYLSDKYRQGRASGAAGWLASCGAVQCCASRGGGGVCLLGPQTRQPLHAAFVTSPHDSRAAGGWLEVGPAVNAASLCADAPRH
jgi:hypothetical protein